MADGNPVSCQENIKSVLQKPQRNPHSAALGLYFYQIVHIKNNFIRNVVFIIFQPFLGMVDIQNVYCLELAIVFLNKNPGKILSVHDHLAWRQGKCIMRCPLSHYQ